MVLVPVDAVGVVKDGPDHDGCDLIYARGVVPDALERLRGKLLLLGWGVQMQHHSLLLSNDIRSRPDLPSPREKVSHTTICAAGNSPRCTHTARQTPL